VELSERGFHGVSESAGGKCRLVGDRAACDPRCADERDPVGVVVAFSGGLVDQVTDGVVDEEEPVEFLFGPRPGVAIAGIGGIRRGGS
jgi:hypothetical protein